MIKDAGYLRNVLRRQLGLVAVTALVVGEVVGIGIFLTPAGMARSLGSPFWLLIVWLLMGLMALSGALCYGELARVGRKRAAGTSTCAKRMARGSHSSTVGNACSSWIRASRRPRGRSRELHGLRAGISGGWLKGIAIDPS